MRTLQVDIEGLDLVLGGGFALLERVAGAGESATILIRGPAGSGKTVLGTQFAASIARALGTDVAYGCVELLPAELRAQHEGVRAKSANEKVVFLSEDSVDPDHSAVRIYAGLLDLGEDATAPARLGEAVDTLLKAATARAQRKVRVLVVDSLSEGYGLGANASRALADGVSKFAAEQGLVVILLEEQAREGSSVWGFAVDTVFELKPPEEGTPFERRLLISKHRLGPSDPGPHEFSVLPGSGVILYPRVAAYLKPWTSEVFRTLKAGKKPARRWPIDELIKWTHWLPPFGMATIAVVGMDSMLVSQFALALGDVKQPGLGPSIKIPLGLPEPGSDASSEDTQAANLFLSPLWSSARSLSGLRREIERQTLVGEAPSCVIVGDLRGVAHYSEPEEVFQAVSAIASLLRGVEIPLVVYETSSTDRSVMMSMFNANVVVNCLGGQRKAERVGMNATVSTRSRIWSFVAELW